MLKNILSIVLLCGCMTVQSQSLSDIFKSFSSSSSTKSEEVKSPAPSITETSMLGSWNFTKLAVDLAEDSALKGFAGTAIVKQVENLLNATASSSGISEGMFVLTFVDKRKATIAFKDSKGVIESIYSVDKLNNTISLEVGKINDIEVGTLTANVSIADDSATLLIDAKVLIAIADQLPSLVDNTQYAMVKGVASSVDGLLIGFVVQGL